MGELALARGVRYRHLQQTSPEGQPWSVHLLEVSRREATVELRAVAGRGEDGSMRRELPTVMAQHALACGEHVVGVVNGDFDLGGNYLGIPDGLSVTSGTIWTTGRPGWPATAVQRSRKAVIGVPEVSIELRADKNRWQIGALNKPLDSVHGPQPRLYTRQFRPKLFSGRPFRAVVIGHLAHGLPLRVDSTVRGRVDKVIRETTELEIPPDALLVGQTMDAEPAGAPITNLSVGEEVRINLRVRVAGQSGVREAIGGFPIIVRDGRAEIVGDPNPYLRLRHPRTAVCNTRASTIFAVVDGRQPDLSVGMTLEELAELMVSLGCEVAMNTDGGGSSVMAVALPAAEPPATTSHRLHLPNIPGVGPRAGEAAPWATGQGAPWMLRRPLSSCNFGSEISAVKIVNSPSDGAERGRGNAWLIVARP